MHALLSLFTVTLSILYSGYYLWYLTWPIVNGQVVGSHFYEIPSVVRSTRYSRIISYKFDCDGHTIYSNKQGLFVKHGMTFNLLKSDKLRIRACSLMIHLSCPDNKLKNLLHLMAFQCLFLFLTAVFVTAL